MSLFRNYILIILHIRNVVWLVHLYVAIIVFISLFMFYKFLCSFFSLFYVYVFPFSIPKYFLVRSSLG